VTLYIVLTSNPNIL